MRSRCIQVLLLDEPFAGLDVTIKTRLYEQIRELCATFDRESTEPPARSTSDFWRHGAGRQCFELEVDKTRR